MHTNKKTDGLSKGSIGKQLLQSEKFTLFIALAVIIIIFQSLNNNYLLPNNIVNILVAMSLTGMVAIGQTYLMIAGHMDMSSGAVAAFSGVLTAKLLTELNLSTGITLLIIVLTGILIGFVNAFLITKLKFNHFIATLATQSIFRGLAYIICDGKSISITNQGFLKLGITRIFGIPIPVILFLVLMIVAGILLSRTRFGRSIYMIGGNPTAARLAGLSETKVKTILFCGTSALTALGGSILASRMNSGQPSASPTLEFDAITAAVLGGVALQGGIGSMSGCLIGLFIMTGFTNGLQILNVQTFWQNVAKGILLIVALSFDYYRNKTRLKSNIK